MLKLWMPYSQSLVTRPQFRTLDAGIGALSGRARSGTRHPATTPTAHSGGFQDPWDCLTTPDSYSPHCGFQGHLSRHRYFAIKCTKGLTFGMYMVRYKMALFYDIRRILWARAGLWLY